MLLYSDFLTSQIQSFTKSGSSCFQNPSRIWPLFPTSTFLPLSKLLPSLDGKYNLWTVDYSCELAALRFSWALDLTVGHLCWSFSMWIRSCYSSWLPVTCGPKSSDFIMPRRYHMIQPLICLSHCLLLFLSIISFSHIALFGNNTHSTSGTFNCPLCLEFLSIDI